MIRHATPAIQRIGCRYSQRDAATPLLPVAFDAVTCYYALMLADAGRLFDGRLIQP